MTPALAWRGASRLHDAIMPRRSYSRAPPRRVRGRPGKAAPRPVPDQTGITNYVDSNNHVISLGGSVRFRLPWNLARNPFRFDVAGQIHLLESRSVVKLDPEGPVGDYTSDGEIFVGGGFLSYAF